MIILGFGVFDMNIVNSAIAALIDFFRRSLGATAFLAAEKSLVRLGAYAAAVAAFCGAGLGLYLAVKNDETSLLFISVGWAFLVAVMHYIGSRMLVGGRVVLRNAPTDISSQDYLEVLGLCCILMFAGSLVGGLYVAVKTSDFDFLWYGLGLSMVALSFASMYLNPSIINAQVKPSASAGEDAIAISALTLKTFIRLSPMVFSLLTLAGGATLGWSALKLIKQDEVQMYIVGFTSFSGFGLASLGLLYPLISYLVFVSGYLVLDMARSILMISRIAGGGGDRVAADLEDDNSEVLEFTPSQQAKLQSILIGIGCVLVLGVVGIQGKVYYNEYRQRAEAQRIEEDRLAAEKQAAEELAKQEEAAKQAELNRIATIARNTTAMKGQASIDLLMQPQVSESMRSMLGDQLSIFEQYFAESQPVQVEGGYVIGTGCMVESCGVSEGVFVVNLEKGTLHAAVVNQGRVQILGGERQSSAPPPIRKWLIRFQ